MENDKTFRQIVIEWWHTLSPKAKQAYIGLVLDDWKRSYTTLTGREIEKIYRWEKTEFKH